MQQPRRVEKRSGAANSGRSRLQPALDPLEKRVQFFMKFRGPKALSNRRQKPIVFFSA
jgi:hypothetical protein